MLESQLPFGRYRNEHGREPSLGSHYRVLDLLIRAGGLYRRGFANFLDLRVVQIEHAIDGLPARLDGLRILQISDLHLDLYPALADNVCRALSGIECDLICSTGDFWEGQRAQLEPAKAAWDRICSQLPPAPLGHYAVPGNHDNLADLDWLQQHGLRVLVNQCEVLRHNGLPFVLCGIEDAYRYKLHHFKGELNRLPASLPAILLSHSPQVAPHAAALGYKLMLSGHTHGGQVCLPGGVPIMGMPGIPNRLFAGRWKVGGMLGYTSRGTGATHLPLRFNCPPEITLHTLRPASI